MLDPVDDEAARRCGLTGVTRRHELSGGMDEDGAVVVAGRGPGCGGAAGSGGDDSGGEEASVRVGPRTTCSRDEARPGWWWLRGAVVLLDPVEMTAVEKKRVYTWGRGRRAVVTRRGWGGGGGRGRRRYSDPVGNDGGEGEEEKVKRQPFIKVGTFCPGWINDPGVKDL